MPGNPPLSGSKNRQIRQNGGPVAEVGLGRMEGELHKVKDELRRLAERVARIEGMRERDRTPTAPAAE